jgi:RNA recognition motif-containing protein
VEFYFSDANITKDKFLLKHVKRNKEGFVSLKLISSFKRVKHLTKDWRQVAYAIKKCSDRLEVNDLETKVRRLEELPPYDETTPSRTVVVLNLPMDRPTIEGVAEIFRACGEIVLVRILRPGNPVPADIKQYVAKHPEMTTKVCALVEFERTEFAQKAVRELHNEEEEDKMKVMELTATPLKNGNKKIEARKLAEKAAAAAFAKAGAAVAMPQRKFSLQNNYINQNPMTAIMGPQRTRRISLMPNMKFGPICEDLKENVLPSGSGGRKEFALNPNAPSFQMNEDGTFQMIPPLNQPQPPPPQRRKPAVFMGEAPGFVGVPTRRFSGQFTMGGGGFEAAAAGLKLPANVVRLPKGPDQGQGKGFNNWCRQRMSEPKRVSKAIPIVAPPSSTAAASAAAAPKTIVTLSESPEEEMVVMKPNKEEKEEEEQKPAAESTSADSHLKVCVDEFHIFFTIFQKKFVHAGACYPAGGRVRCREQQQRGGRGGGSWRSWTQSADGEARQLRQRPRGQLLRAG